MNTLNYIIDNSALILTYSWEHLWIVGLSLLISIFTGVPLGIFITRNEQLAQKVLNTANALMTIPSIALFGLMLPLLSVFNLGLGKVPAVIALVLYSQLPIIRNTYAAIKNVPPSVVNAGKGMGMNRWNLLREVQIPISVPLILAGVRTAAVMNIGVAAIASYVGAGGLGVLIQQGIDSSCDEMILAGAILVSLMAIIVDALMALLERVFTPRGIILQRRQTR